ncbi:hypothetical protein P4631_09055 [Halalkalibacterium halodurans]|uniref:hypothetical protein n=1 Tax=Halalkalibacterium halodurans TaxID=86665 RepID=UPI002E1D89FA|nr:hypothetical protein [Halalkalibacterium halodurans]
MSRFKFDLNENYRDRFRSYVDDIMSSKDYRNITNNERISIVTELTESYIETTKERPPNEGLTILSDFILREKTEGRTQKDYREDEYPFQSVDQEKRRMSYMSPEVLYANYDTEGRNQAPPTRLNKRNARLLQGIEVGARKRKRRLKRGQSEA